MNHRFLHLLFFEVKIFYVNKFFMTSLKIEYS